MFTPLGTPTSQLSIGDAFAGVRAAFRAIAGIAPRHEILLPFEKRIEVGVGGGDQRVARVALVGGNDVPLLGRRILQVGVGVEQPIAGRRPEDLDLGDLVVIHAQPRAEDIRLLLVRHDHFGERLTRRGVEQAAMVIDLHRRLDHARVDIGGRRVLHVAETRRQRQTGRIALRLRVDIKLTARCNPSRAHETWAKPVAGAASAAASTIHPSL